MKKRIISLFVIFCLILTAFIGRLVFIQLMKGQEYKELATAQSYSVLTGINQRGQIYDRNGNPMTEMKEGFLLLIEKRKINSDSQGLLEKLNAVKINEADERYVIYSTSTLNREVSDLLCADYGALTFRARQRYQSAQPAIHLIGYINQQDSTGACGIEKDFEEILSGGEKAYSAKTDGQGYLIPGTFLCAPGETQEWGVLTTLDLELQRSAEQILLDSEASGVIIVTNPETGEILASASSPIFDPYRIEDYLNSSSREFLNKATQCEYPPGSIFKIIVAAAALESGAATTDSIFNCDGEYSFHGQTIKCSTGGEEGHGEITLEEAFSDSCNSAFVQLGEKVGAAAILDMALAFGLTKEAVSDISGQLPGNLPTKEDASGAGIGNLSIGQGQLLVTPMQVARITEIIASGGLDPGLSLIRGTAEGEKGISLKSKSTPKRVISWETAEQIREMMAETVSNGTANNLVLPVGMSAGGKTGSAEAAIGEEEFVHSWFTGFIPSSAPKYVITVFVENGGSGRASAVPLFQQMVDAIGTLKN